jgi:hypothetical protein
LEKPRPASLYLGFNKIGVSADGRAVTAFKKKTKKKEKKKKKSRFGVCVCVLLSFSFSLSFLYYYKKGDREEASRQRTAPAFEAFAAARNARSLSLTLSSYQSFYLSLSLF